MDCGKINTKYLYTALIHYPVFANSNVDNTIEYCGSRQNIYKVIINNSNILCYTYRQKIYTMKNFGLQQNKYKALIQKLLYIVQYFYAVHYHCSVLGIVPTIYETIQYIQSTNKYQTNPFSKHTKKATHYVKDHKYSF